MACLGSFQVAITCAQLPLLHVAPVLHISSVPELLSMPVVPEQASNPPLTLGTLHPHLVSAFSMHDCFLHLYAVLGLGSHLVPVHNEPPEWQCKTEELYYHSPIVEIYHEGQCLSGWDVVAHKMRHMGWFRILGGQLEKLGWVLVLVHDSGLF